MSLTDTWLKANHNKAVQKVQVHTDRDGLSVRQTLKGKIVFQLRYRFDGKAKRLDLGSYPLMGLKAARGEAQRLRASLEQGNDPKTVKALEKQSVIEANSLTEVFENWYVSYCVDHKTIHVQLNRSFEIYVFPKLGELPFKDISLHAWLGLLEPLSKTKPSIADRILTNTKQLYKWAIKRQLVAFNPLADINAKEDLFIKKIAGGRSLNDDEIKHLWLAISKSRMAQKNKIFLKLNLLFACRNGELRLSKKRDFDFSRNVWTVPIENHKLGNSTQKPLKRPITPAAKELIEEAMLLSGKSDYLFSNANSNEPMGRSASLSLPYNLMQWLRKNMEYEMDHWSMHDLRKTARTNFSTLTEPHIAEIMLGHKLPGDWQTYDQHDYLEEQAEAYRKWWDRVLKIIK